MRCWLCADKSQRVGNHTDRWLCMIDRRVAVFMFMSLFIEPDHE